MRRDTLRLIALLLLALAPASLAAQAPIRCRGPLSEEDMRVLIEGQVAEKRLRDIVTTCGVGFPLTAEAEQRLRSAGATDVVVAAVRRESEKAETKEALALRAELTFWESIKESKRAELYETYLARYPRGQFAIVARVKLGELKLEKLRPEIEADLQARRWAEAEAKIKGLRSFAPDNEDLAGWLSVITKGREEDRKKEEKAEQLRRAIKEMEFVSIPPGEFEMGCSPGDSECDWDKDPRRRVRITKGFEIGKYEVTQAQWEAVMGNNPSEFKAPGRPVEKVSWNDAQKFLAKLNARNDGHHYRLPTEAEWEYAARAGTKDARYGYSVDEVGWYHGNARRKTHPVGQKKPNAWGLYDMLGNVGEWCADWYQKDYYRNSPTTDPPGPSSGDGRVVRGGSWDDAAWRLRVSYCYWDYPDVRYDFHGFRCARE